MEQVGLLALSSVLNVMLSTPPLPPPQSYTLLSPEHGQMATNCSEMINSKCCKDQCIKTSVCSERAYRWGPNRFTPESENQNFS